MQPRTSEPPDKWPWTNYVTANSNKSISSGPPTVSRMAHSIVSGMWMTLDAAWMLLSTSASVSVLSVADYKVQRHQTHGRRIAALSVIERALRRWKRATTSVMACRRPLVGDRCDQVGHVIWCVSAWLLEVLRGSSGLNALLIMEGKISGVKARGRPRRAWTDDLKDWTELRNYSELKRTAEDTTIWNALARQPST